MLLRTIARQIKEQNWFAVGLDFIIVVIGVFIGIQLGNWNEARVANNYEKKLLAELRNELSATISASSQKAGAYRQVAEAGKRSSAFLDADISCADSCWHELVDLMHASQWQRLDVTLSTYEEMRSLGLPRSRKIVDAVELFIAQNVNIASSMQELPRYRSSVRELVPLTAQEFYWNNCFSLVGGAETYVLDCPKGISDAEAQKIVARIRQDDTIARFLTEWIGNILIIPKDLEAQNVAAAEAIKAIDTELRSQ